MTNPMQPRRTLTRDEWSHMANEAAPPLMGLWADTHEVYALLREGEKPLLVSTNVGDRGYPALSPARPRAVWFERMVRDLWGHTAIGGTDERPWLDHGCWPIRAPLASRPGVPLRPEPPEFAFGDGLDQFPIGPVRGGIQPAAHLRLGIHGETVVRMEARLGYTHKGTLALMRGKSPRAAARYAARLVGEATVAHSTAFARAAEGALGSEVPPRALVLRDAMAEVERIAGNLSRLAAMAEAGENDVLATRCAWHVEAIHRSANVAFGHRLMMDCVVPGGLAVDIVPGGSEGIGRALSALGSELSALGSLTRRLSRVGDVVHTVGEGVRRAQHILETVPEGPASLPLAGSSGEGLGFANGPDGEIWHWLKLDGGQIVSVFMCDAAWAQWRAFETAMSGARVEDLPLIIAMVGVSSSGVDL